MSSSRRSHSSATLALSAALPTALLACRALRYALRASGSALMAARSFSASEAARSNSGHLRIRLGSVNRLSSWSASYSSDCSFSFRRCSFSITSRGSRGLCCSRLCALMYSLRRMRNSSLRSSPAMLSAAPAAAPADAPAAPASTSGVADATAAAAARADAWALGAASIGLSAAAGTGARAFAAGISSSSRRTDCAGSRRAHVPLWLPCGCAGGGMASCGAALGAPG